MAKVSAKVAARITTQLKKISEHLIQPAKARRQALIAYGRKVIHNSSLDCNHDELDTNGCPKTTYRYCNRTSHL